jgi:hypothetical protein
MWPSRPVTGIALLTYVCLMCVLSTYYVLCVYYVCIICVFCVYFERIMCVLLVYYVFITLCVGNILCEKTSGNKNIENRNEIC